MIKVEGPGFEAASLKFDWSDEDWAATWLPWVRITALHVASDENNLTHVMTKVVENGKAEDILKGLAQTKMHLEALRNIIENALIRTSFVAGQLGYTPGNPPPNCPLN